MRKKSAILYSVYIILLSNAANAAESITIEERVEVTDSSGRSMSFIQVLRPNKDGTYTIIDLKPKEEVYSFLDEACKMDIGPSAYYNGIEGGITISEKAQFGYSCQVKK